MFDILIPPLDRNKVFTPPVTDEERLALAIRSGDLEGIKALIAQHPDLLDGNLDEEYEYHTPLSYAASLGLCPVIETLLDLGASPSHSTHILGLPPLAAASQPGSTLTPTKVAEVFKIMLDHTKKSGNEAVKQLTEWRGLEGDTLLTLLSEGGHAIAIKYLLAVAPELLACARNDGNYPLHLAIINGHDLAAEILLEEAPKIANEINDQENSPLLLSMRYNSSPAFTERLLKCGADVNSTDPAGNSALILACYLEDETKATIILKYDPDTTLVNIHNMAAISYAALSGKPELIKLFREKNKPKPEDVIPPHLHLVLSPLLDDRVFREMLAEISAQGFSIREQDNLTMAQLNSSSILKKRKLKILAKQNKIGLLSLSNSHINREIPQDQDATGDIFYSMDPLSNTETNLISRIFHIFERIICIVDQEFDINDVKTNFEFKYSEAFHRVDAVKSGFDFSEVALITYCFPKKISTQELSYLLESEIFSCFLKNLKIGLSGKKNLVTLRKQEKISLFFSSLYEYNRQNKIDYINDLLITYSYELAIDDLKNNNQVGFFGNIDKFVECFNGSIKHILLYKRLIYLFNKKHPIYDKTSLAIITSFQKRISEKLDQYRDAEKLIENSDPDQYEERSKIYIFLLMHIHDITIKAGNQLFLFEIKTKDERFFRCVHDELIKAEASVKIVNFFCQSLPEFNKNRIKLNEIIFEYKYQICLFLKDNIEKKDEVLEKAKSALTIPAPKNNPLQSESDRDRKRRILRRIIKELNKNDASLEKVQESATVNPTVSESDSDNAGPSTPPEAEVKLPLKSDVQTNTNIIAKQMAAAAHADYIRLVESQQLSTLHTRKRHKAPAQPAGNSRANIAPVPIKQPKWSEAEVREIYGDLLKPGDELVILERPGRPYGSYWGIFRLNENDYDDPNEYEQDSNKFKEGAIMCTKGVFYMHNPGKGNRPHATCHTTKNGPVLVDVNKLYSHEDHEELLRRGFAPKPHLLRTPVPV